MKRFFIIAFLSAISQFVVGQKEMAKVGLIPDFSSSDFQLFSFRDTMFLFCEYQMNNAFGSEMILPDGNLVSLPMRHLNQYSICGMTTYGSVKTFYTLEEKRKKIIVTSYNLDIKKNQRSNEVRDTITGNLLGVSNYNNQMVFFSYEKKDFVLVISEFSSKGLFIQKRYKMPFDLFQVSKKDITFFHENDIIGPEQARAKLKIINTVDTLKIVKDQVFVNSKQDEATFTKVILIDKKSSEIQIQQFREASKLDFVSNVFGKYLYRYIRSSNFLELQVFDLSSGVRSQLCKIEKSKSLKTNLIFKHLNDSISQSATAFDFYKSQGENYMTINSNSTGAIFISLGNYNVNSRPIGFLNLRGPLIPSVVTFAITTLYLRSQPFFKTDGLFMYLTGNRLNGYSILNDQSSPKGTLNERILNFEKNFPNLQFKDYFDFETQLTAIYKYSADSDFTFVRFDK